MSLFDVLRWPISIPPTEAELAILPKEILVNWKCKVHFLNGATPLDISLHYGKFLHISYLESDIAQLRKMIKEYNNELI